MTSRYAPYEIYKNLQALFEYRAVTTDDKFDLTAENFTKMFLSYGYHRVVGEDTRRNNRRVIMVIVAPNTNADSKVAQFKKVLTAVATVDFKKTPTEIIFITNRPFTTFIKEAIEEEKKAHPLLTIEQHSYITYIIVIPRHILVPPHRILSSAELAEFTKTYSLIKTSFERIRLTDPMVIWLGARAGEVIEVQRESEANGKSISYKLVK